MSLHFTNARFDYGCTKINAKIQDLTAGNLS